MTAREFCRMVEKGECQPGEYTIERYGKPKWRVVVTDVSGVGLEVVAVDQKKKALVVKLVAEPEMERPVCVLPKHEPWTAPDGRQIPVVTDGLHLPMPSPPADFYSRSAAKRREWVQKNWPDLLRGDDQDEDRVQERLAEFRVRSGGF